jgi:hypothetical protein
MDALMNDGDLFKFDIIMKLLSFGVDGMNNFQVRFLVFTILVFIGFVLRFEGFCCSGFYI